MSRSFWWLRAETSIHVGAGRTASLVDLPVIREAGTGYPFLPGSSFKGALRDRWRLKTAQTSSANEASALTKADKDDDVVKLFGSEDGAGSILISDARLFLLPVRSLCHAFVWVTCPYLIRRLNRDIEFCYLGKKGCFKIAERGVAGDDVIFDGSGSLWLEDLRLRRVDGDTKSIRDAVGVMDVAEGHLAVVSDEIFGFLTSRRLPVRTRNRLEPDTKTVVTGALWSEESLAPETIFYAMFSSRVPGAKALEAFDKDLTADPYLQVGGNETVGEGWLSLHPHRPEGGRHVS